MSNHNKPIIGLGLESSCDETAAAIVLDGKTVAANIISSQIDLHKEYYGVVPELASRAHLEIINSLIDSALAKAGISFDGLSYVAATSRPGLVGSLLIALQSAKVISYVQKIPLIGVNHLEGHLYAPFLEGNEPEYPFIGLLVSGGNTVLYKVNGVADMEVIGKTTDDAVGEAFDKVAKYLEMGYPGGPLIEKLAKTATERKVFLPKLLAASKDYRFSYSGIKTAVITHMRNHPDTPPEELVYSFQERALEILVRRVFAAAREYNIKTMVVAGGVAANGRLREMLNEKKRGREKIIIPSPILCTDNAAMVAGIGYHYFVKKQFDDFELDVKPRV